MKLIIGASSYIGNYLFSALKKTGEGVIGTYNSNSNSEYIHFDIEKDDHLIFFNSLKNEIDTIIICSAVTSIDRCKAEAHRSWVINVEKIISIINIANSLGCKIVFLSSEAVFNGEIGFYRESDVPNPVTFYGKEKLEVENYIYSNVDNYLVFRISRAVSTKIDNKGILNEFKNLMDNNKSVYCIEDQIFSLTDVEDVANVIIKAMEKELVGLYHISNGSMISRDELARKFADIVVGKLPDIIVKKLEEFEFIDTRHLRCGLCGEKLNRIINYKYKSIEDILREYKCNLI